MAEPLISFTKSSITVEGRLFEGDASVRVKNALAKEVRALAERGKQRVVSGIVTKHGTGFTAAHVEIHQKYANSLFATIRMEPGLVREPGTTVYPAKRRAYIVNAILESGRYSGKYQRTVRVSQRTGRARLRKTWHSGERRQRPLLMWRNAAYALRRDAANVRAELIARELA